MQPDLEPGESKVSPQSAYNIGYERIPVSNGRSSIQMAEMVVGGVSHESLVGQLRGTPRRRPSPMMWHFVVTIGDGVLLITLLALLLMIAPPLHLGLQVSSYGLGTWNSKLVWGCLALVSWGIAVSITQAQKPVYISSRFSSPLNVLFALVLMGIFCMGLTYLFIADRATSYIMLLLLFLLVAAPAVSGWRIVLAEFMSLPRFRHQSVIVGVNTAGKTIARELCSTKRPGANVLGYIGESSDESTQKEDMLPVLGGRSTLRYLAQNGFIDLIIMAIDHRVNPGLFQEAIEATQLGISVVPMTMVYERTSGRIAVEYIGDQWYVALPSERIVSLLYLCWRKMLDFAFGLFGSMLLLLILPILALLIYLDSPGPILYSQERLGYQGRKFRILKFRSMRIDAESPEGAMWATKHDMRVTRLGRFMRATHLDELPQVLNILRGEMSLIGPRPERQVFVSQLEKTIPFYHCRLSVKPGLTGWAQVKYPYTSTGHDALVKLQYDLYYIKYQSFALDIFIILKTVVEVLRYHGR